MARTDLPPVADLRKFLDYDPSIGTFHWKGKEPADFPHLPEEDRERAAAYFNTRFGGKEAGSIDRLGYRKISINGKVHGAHRIAFALENNRWPTETIDHINRDPTDNRIENLREVSLAENCRNRRHRNTRFVQGVRPGNRGWVADIIFDATNHLGTFDTFEEARAARSAAEKVLGFNRAGANDDL